MPSEAPANCKTNSDYIKAAFKALSADWTTTVEVAGAGGLAIELAIIVISGIGAPARALRWIIGKALEHEVYSWVRSWFAWTSGGALFALSKVWPNATISAVGVIADEITCWTPAAVDLAAMTMQQITGLPINREALKLSATEGKNLELSEDLGGQFMLLVPAVFNLQDAIGDHSTRTGSVGSLKNLARFMGTNLNFQLRSLTISTISSMFGWEPLRHLEGLHQSINWAFGFGWMSWAVMSEYMNVAVYPGLRRSLNNQVQTKDLTDSQATQAYVRGLIDEGVWKQILTNDGLRYDIRTILFDLARKELTAADLRALYEHGSVDAAGVNKYFRLQGYAENEAAYKTEMVENERLWSLQKELLNVQETQFAHGIIDEATFRNAMIPLHFSAAEEDLEVAIAKAKATLLRVAAPKRITGSFNITNPNPKTGKPAIASWHFAHADSVEITDLGPVPLRGERIVPNPETKTYYATVKQGQDTETFEAVVVVPGMAEQKRPSVSFSASPGSITPLSQVELKWSTDRADSVVIDGIGPVAESGSMIVFPLVTTIYTIRATNSAGTSVRTDAVLVHPPSLPSLEALQPKVTFSVTPGVVKASQPQTELNWVVERADKVELVFPDGHTETVGNVEARVYQVSASGVFKIKATNTYGTTERDQAVIWTEPATEPPP